MKDYDRLLEGRHAFITAGTQGIGKDVAPLFVQQGAQAEIGGRNPGFLAKTIEEIRVYSSESKGYVVKPSSEEQVEQTVGQVFKDMQRVDILVSTIGANVHRRTDERNDELLERISETNYKSGLKFSRRFIPGTMERRYGIIINISFIHSMTTMPGSGMHTGVKGAMNVIIRAIALDHADYGIRADIICPGLIMSDNMMDEIYGYQEDPERDAFMEVLNHMQPLAPGKMESISNAALYFASDMSSYITGQIIIADGGASIKAHQGGGKDELF